MSDQEQVGEHIRKFASKGGTMLIVRKPGMDILVGHPLHLSSGLPDLAGECQQQTPQAMKLSPVPSLAKFKHQLSRAFEIHVGQSIYSTRLIFRQGAFTRGE